MSDIERARTYYAQVISVADYAKAILFLSQASRALINMLFSLLRL